ncbi:hypothetical protein EDD18DRAFT_1160986 [Armillaria luteobubalina]|uniref:F-box domain-containing protein n=1 Tax=Armillaria luteobubalina TaxID=153913 RepID=A0AA39UNY6_9AGAR|nr:hypothetical protein EDD18DRAFT_1160986 [Armillaria luteobubalina]
MMTDTGKRIDTLDAHVLELKVLKQAFLARVDEELSALDKERQRLSDSIQERQRVLGALRRVPKEVLAHIFSHTLVFHFPQVKPISHSIWTPVFWSSVSASKHPLLTFELVSRNWKDILDTFPYLWSYVNILIERMTSNTYIRYIGNQLSRSRQSSDAIPAAILMALFTASPRVKTLRLCLPGNHFTDMHKLHLSFPNLQEVAQHLHFGRLPHLQVLHFMDISNFYTLSLPWHQITHFTSQQTQVGHGPPAHRVLDILKMMSRLSVCLFSLDLQSLTTKLNSFTLESVYRQGFDFPPVIPFVLNALKLPALLDLSDTTFTSIRHLIERSQSPLTSLHFDNGEILENDLIHTLSSTPNLQDLRLTNVGGEITDQVVNELARRVDTESGSPVPVLVPHLRTLHLSGHLNFQVELYVRMSVEEREEEEEANALVLSRLDVLVTEGLNVSVNMQRM